MLTVHETRDYLAEQLESHARAAHLGVAVDFPFGADSQVGVVCRHVRETHGALGYLELLTVGQDFALHDVTAVCRRHRRPVPGKHGAAGHEGVSNVEIDDDIVTE